MKEEYLKMIQTINKSINSFNSYLNSSFIIPNLDINKISDNSYFTSLANTTWLDLRFPNSDKRGVYFIVGYDTNNIITKSMYIGKASFSSSIGKRLYSHLNKDKNNEHYTMYDLDGNINNLEYIFSIDLESLGIDILSSSLEEFLILNLKNEIHLLNGTGNY